MVQRTPSRNTSCFSTRQIICCPSVCRHCYHKKGARDCNCKYVGSTMRRQVKFGCRCLGLHWKNADSHPRMALDTETYQLLGLSTSDTACGCKVEDIRSGNVAVCPIGNTHVDDANQFASVDFERGRSGARRKKKKARRRKRSAPSYLAQIAKHMCHFGMMDYFNQVISSIGFRNCRRNSSAFDGTSRFAFVAGKKKSDFSIRGVIIVYAIL